MTISVAIVNLGTRSLTHSSLAEGYCESLNADPRFWAEVCSGLGSGMLHLGNIPEDTCKHKWLVVLVDRPVRTIAPAAKAVCPDANVLVMVDADDGSSPLTPLPLTKEMLKAREPIAILAPGGMNRFALRELLALVA